MGFLAIKLDKDPKIHDLMQGKRSTKLDRALIKAIVMPLIYGKTPYGFAEDLQSFLAKHYLYPSNSILLKLAHLIIVKLKGHKNLTNANLFMASMQNFAKMLFAINNVVLVGVYSNCQLNYNQVKVEQLNVYTRKKNIGIQRQRIRLTTLKKKFTGCFYEVKNKNS